MTVLATEISFIEKTGKTKRPITIKAFNQLYANKDDEYRYEWNNGLVEKTPRLSMNRSQLSIARKLTRFFSSTQAFKQLGELAWEIIMYLPTAKRNRIADFAYLTNEQVEEQEDLFPSVSTFVIEIISKNDKADEVQLKLQQYFSDGVQVVWHIFPSQKTVHVYTSLYDVQICHGVKLCSAAPVLPDFNIPAQDIFI